MATLFDIVCKLLSMLQAHSDAIQACASLVGLLAIVLLWFQVRSTNKWNRVSAAFSLLDIERFAELEVKAINTLKQLGIDFPADISKADAERIRGNFKAYHALKGFMMFLDRIAVSIQMTYADDRLMCATWGPIIVGFYDHLEKYIEFVRGEMQSPEDYKCFQECAAKYSARLQKAQCRY